MGDILPESWRAFDFICQTFSRLAVDAGYGRIETPILENAELFSRGVGDATDIVEKEMYLLQDRSDNALALRPEGTAPIVRAYLEHGMGSWPQPVRLYYISSMLRYDRPQAGRRRQFWQVGAEILGDDSASSDASVIVLAERFWRELGLKNVSLQINSLGDKACRPKYQKALKTYLQTKANELSEDSARRLNTNPLRILDSKDPADQPIVAGAPQMLDFLCAECSAHFKQVLEYLDEVGVCYELNPRLVRGLDYYARTVFEYYGFKDGAQSSLGAGGRYDGLSELLGGGRLPGVGIGLGLERIKLELETQNIALPPTATPQVFVISLGDPARLSAFALMEGLIGQSVATEGALGKSSLQAQLAKADRLGAKIAVIIGQKEVLEQTCILRDMVTGVQDTVTIKKAVAEIARRVSDKSSSDG